MVKDIVLFNLIVESAVRYALGRRTYIVSVTCTFIKENMSLLSEKTLLNIKNDIESASDLGDDCDKKEWLSLLEKIKEVEKKN